MKLPFILILDIDATIIGNIGPCITEADILNTIYKICIKNNTVLPTPCQKDDMLDIQDELKNGLLRPYAKDFIVYCEKKFKYLEVFFYTNSSYRWANGPLVREIEKALKYKANRPLFTREDSIDMTKTISNIYPQILKSLLKKYPMMTNPKHVATVFKERMIFIDDTANNLEDYPSRQIQCPGYKFAPKYDIYHKLQEKYNIPSDVFDDPEVLLKFERFDIPVYNKNGSIYQQDIEYYHLHSLYLAKTRELEQKGTPPEDDDTFFKDLIKTFEKIDVLTDKEIAKVNSALKKNSKN